MALAVKYKKDDGTAQSCGGVSIRDGGGRERDGEHLADFFFFCKIIRWREKGHTKPRFPHCL